MQAVSDDNNPYRSPLVTLRSPLTAELDLLRRTKRAAVIAIAIFAVILAISFAGLILDGSPLWLRGAYVLYIATVFPLTWPLLGQFRDARRELQQLEEAEET